MSDFRNVCEWNERGREDHYGSASGFLRLPAVLRGSPSFGWDRLAKWPSDGAPASRAVGLNSISAFPRSSHTSDSKISTPVATLSGAWRYRVNAGTGWPGVSALSLGEIASLICNFYLDLAARTIVSADPTLLDVAGRLSNQQTTTCGWRVIT